MIAKISKIGPCVQLGDAAKDKPKFASLKKGQSIFSITLSEALDLFRTALPKPLGEYNGKEVSVGEGKYGPYIHYGKSFVSLPHGKDPLSISLQEAIQLLAQKSRTEQPIHEWGDIQVLRGRYGDYIHTPKGNYSIPKGTDGQTLTEAEVREIVEKTQPLKPAKRFFNRKSAK